MPFLTALNVSIGDQQAHCACEFIDYCYTPIPDHATDYVCLHDLLGLILVKTEKVWSGNKAICITSKD